MAIEIETAELDFSWKVDWISIKSNKIVIVVKFYLHNKFVYGQACYMEQGLGQARAALYCELRLMAM